MRFLPLLLAAVLALALAAPAKADNGYRECGKANGWRMVAGSPDTTCGFVRAVRKSISRYQDSHDVPVGSSFSVKAKSPTTGKTYRMRCLADVGEGGKGFQVLCNSATGATANFFKR